MKDKKLHEALTNDIVNLDKPNNYKISDYYLDKVPFNYIGSIENKTINKKTNELILSEDDIQKLFERTNLNVGNDSNIGFYEKMLIKEKNYIGLTDLLKKKYPYNKQCEFMVYSYARKLCGKSLKQRDYQKISSDKAYLEKKMIIADSNKITFTKNSKYTIKFN
tara:strand:+ start:630 stop:1121 length:492 start_codon:yes stop_codon:yes gene_type:complete